MALVPIKKSEGKMALPLRWRNSYPGKDYMAYGDIVIYDDQVVYGDVVVYGDLLGDMLVCEDMLVYGDVAVYEDQVVYWKNRTFGHDVVWHNQYKINSLSVDHWFIPIFPTCQL